MFGNFEEAPQNGGQTEPTSGPLCSASLSLTPPAPGSLARFPRSTGHSGMPAISAPAENLRSVSCAPPPPGPLLAHAAQPWPCVELTDRFPSKPSTAHRFRCRNGRALS